MRKQIREQIEARRNAPPFKPPREDRLPRKAKAAKKQKTKVELAEEVDRLKDRIAELEGIPQCSFCLRRAVCRCSARGCKANLCDDHGTIVGSFHFSCRNPKNNFGGAHVLCDRCNGITTSEMQLNDRADRARGEE